jgi:hypothetical protein
MKANVIRKTGNIRNGKEKSFIKFGKRHQPIHKKNNMTKDELAEEIRLDRWATNIARRFLYSEDE